MASEMEFSQHNKVKRRSPWYGPMVLVLLFFVVILVMSLAFRVSRIEVINASEYTDEEIINASGVERGANLFFIDRFKAASMIFSDLPYMDTVSITRQLPNKIVIQAEGSAPAAYMVIDEDYWLLDRRGKMLGTTDSLTAEKYPEIRSLEPMTALEGEDMLVEGTDAERLAVFGQRQTIQSGILPFSVLAQRSVIHRCFRAGGRIAAIRGHSRVDGVYALGGSCPFHSHRAVRIRRDCD